MEDIRTASKLISKACFMATIDLKEAYFSVPIHECDKKFLRFKFQEQNSTPTSPKAYPGIVPLIREAFSRQALAPKLSKS
ncbi:hypothetical protein MSG28_011951 [Choristoneura fumiferana]|uniref:Uncharacterized protein n=1 Tax=Choristoneura fumiferana TaxID=7141 RepID=A0ACC0KNJ5_CHOFU|nr:hypothetical protein MSG28_011951 [Choristoneura fumiferana]